MDTPTPKTSANFNYQVRKRIEELARAKRRAHTYGFLDPIRSFFRSWTGGIAIATACLMVGLVLWQSPRQNQKGYLPDEQIELASIAQNFELIQDMDVIEQLDELAN